MSRREKSKKKSQVKILVIVAVVIVLLGIAFTVKFIKDKQEEDVSGVISLGQEEGKLPEVNQAKKEEIKIYSGNDRPIAVMIDNVGDARPQAGLNKAYVVYEIIVEGGYSRMMAIFKGVDLEKIGPVRSSRHYFLDYALENDSIYVHYGWSPKAQSDITTLGVNNVNGIVTPANVFWRVKDKASPHNAVTSTKNILQYANSKGYRTTSNADSVLRYTEEEVLLEDENAVVANTIKIPYSTSYNVSYQYNEQTKKYERYEDGKLHKDWDTKETISTKNIIITFAKNTTLNDVENKGRQDLSNIGNLNGYYITNGKAIPITCSKTSRKEKTVYKDKQGNEINVNDGNTFIQICPIDADVSIK